MDNQLPGEHMSDLLKRADTVMVGLDIKVARDGDLIPVREMMRHLAAEVRRLQSELGHANDLLRNGVRIQPIRKEIE